MWLTLEVDDLRKARQLVCAVDRDLLRAELRATGTNDLRRRCGAWAKGRWHQHRGLRDARRDRDVHTHASVSVTPPPRDGDFAPGRGEPSTRSGRSVEPVNLGCDGDSRKAWGAVLDADHVFPQPLAKASAQKDLPQCCFLGLARRKALCCDKSRKRHYFTWLRLVSPGNFSQQVVAPCSNQ